MEQTAAKVSNLSTRSAFIALAPTNAHPSASNPNLRRQLRRVDLSVLVPEIKQHHQSRRRMHSECFDSLSVIEHQQYQDTHVPVASQRSSIGGSNAAAMTTVYRSGKRSQRVLRAACCNRGPVSMHAVVLGAELIVRLWDTACADRAAFCHRVSGLTNYMASLLFRACTPPTIYANALFYIHRLRQRYPHAVSESGCSHRLFTVALLVATKYVEMQLSRGQDVCRWSYERWACVTGGLFAVDELKKMEGEFIAFLEYELYTSYAALEYFVDVTVDGEVASAVPASRDWTKDISVERGFEHDGVVPEL